jgi:hypothetical protein
MTKLPRRPSRNFALCVTVFLAFVLVSPGVIIGARADDIPHENYDLVGSNLDFVISLLRSSIRYSEGGLMAMYNQSMADVETNLTVVRGVLIPAERLLVEIKNLTESYGNLSYLLPSFGTLSTQMDSFASMEVSLIGARDTIVSASLLANLTGAEYLNALDAIIRVKSLIDSMYRTIDDMLVSANTTIALVVDGVKPFTDNQLVRLIEKLRDLLFLIDVRIDAIITEQIPWSRTEPFLIFWLSATSYYLGEQISGGGYLYFDGTFAPDHLVQIVMDGQNLTSTQTSGVGEFAFSYPTPIDASWLGAHSLHATADTPNGTLNSAAIGIQILLIPTTLRLDLSQILLSPPESLTASAALTDVKGDSIVSAPCYLILDAENITFTTDSSGEFERSWTGFDLGYGTHSFQAFYEGELPFAPSNSSIVSVEVNIPTSVQVTLLSDRAYLGYFLVVNGSLAANGSTPLPGFEVTLLVDGTAIANITTDAQGKFRLSVPTEGMSLGGHTLVAAFLHREYIWRYSDDSASFTVYGSKQAKYPFFPSIPGWGGLSPPGSFTYLFIGPNAYYFWLLILLLVGITIRVMQTRNARKKALAKARSQMLVSLEQIAEALPTPVPTMDQFAEEIAKEEERQATPNDRVIWYYQRLLAFLTRRDSLSLRASMTHWEVAKLLKNFGYPSSPVDGATILFEKALYSGDELTDNDTVLMSTTLTKLIGAKKAVV